jgi:hypothetical protein
VIRDNYTKDIIAPKETEQETRMSGVLGQLLVGLERIGVEEPERWRLLGKVVLDSMPRLRMLILEQLLANDKRRIETTPAELVERTGCSRSVVDRAVEDLGIHGIVQRGKVEGRVRIELTDWMRQEWKAGWRK